MVILFGSEYIETKDLFACCLLVAFGHGVPGLGQLAYTVNTAYSKGNSKVRFEKYTHCLLLSSVPYFHSVSMRSFKLASFVHCLCLCRRISLCREHSFTTRIFSAFYLCPLFLLLLLLLVPLLFSIHPSCPSSASVFGC
ncbi:hypothetical protein BDW74DRAFT_49695 [Aspergillus multicolor]|uniref:uncharacterized protein n=1 Tax=Aspergillus multicolor TaxID=41759 RepID=UPI003CCD475C